MFQQADVRAIDLGLKGQFFLGHARLQSHLLQHGSYHAAWLLSELIFSVDYSQLHVLMECRELLN